MDIAQLPSFRRYFSDTICCATVAIGSSRVLPFRVLSNPVRVAKTNARQPREISRTLTFADSSLNVQFYASICFVFFSLVASPAVYAQAADRPPDLIEEERVHFGDLIDVDVLGGFEYDWRGGLTPDGNLDISEGYTEPIYALCRSEAEIAADISRLLGKILREPKIVVRILDRSNRAVARLEGAVRTPMRFQIRRPVTLRELIVMAGGLIDGASGEVSIFRPKDSSCKARAASASSNSPDARPKDNSSQMINIKITDLISGKSASDPVVLSGDLVTVSRALPVYIIGAVINPRPIYSREKMTLSRMISSAGGLSKDADSSKIFIFRRSGIEVRSIEADLEKIKRGETHDEILEPFDIIEVASKGGVKRKYPPVMANEQTEESARTLPPLRIIE